jgi:hypothetical protein
VEAERFICGFKLALILLNEGFKLWGTHNG